MQCNAMLSKLHSSIQVLVVNGHEPLSCPRQRVPFSICVYVGMIDQRSTNINQSIFRDFKIWDLTLNSLKNLQSALVRRYKNVRGTDEVGVGICARMPVTGQYGHGR